MVAGEFGGNLTIDNAAKISGFGISRPSGNFVFEAVYAVLSQTSTVMIWSEDGRCVATDKRVVSQLPGWWHKALPPPTIVESVMELEAYLEHSAKKI